MRGCQRQPEERSHGRDYPMDPLPSEWIPQLEENVKAAGTADKIEAVLAQLRPASP